jgi:hypothetical protein
MRWKEVGSSPEDREGEEGEKRFGEMVTEQDPEGVLSLGFTLFVCLVFAFICPVGESFVIEGMCWEQVDS